MNTSEAIPFGKPSPTFIAPQERDHYGRMLLAPLIFIWLTAYIAPLVLLLVISFVRLDSIALEIQGLTLNNYTKFLGDPFYLQVFLRTLNLD
jgi:putative spermidine/putrescine transport system permease protein